jgi:hypothetical protein
MTSHAAGRCLRWASLAMMGLPMPAWARSVHVTAATRPDGGTITWVVLSDAGGARSAVLQCDRDAGVREQPWRELNTLPARVVMVTRHHSEVVLLLEGKGGAGQRQWAWCSDRFSYGPVISEASHILAMAGDGRMLWALALEVQKPRSPAIESAGASTLPAAVGTFSLDGGVWRRANAPWPATWDEGASVSMAIVGDRPVVAVHIEGLVRMFELDARSGQWRRLAGGDPPGRWIASKVLSVGGQPGVWLVGTDEDGTAGRLWMPGRAIVPLALSGPPPSWNDMDLAAAADHLTLVFIRDSRTWEQRFGLDGRPQGSPLEIRRRRPDTPLSDWTTIAIMAIVTVLILNAILRRRNAARDQDRSDEQ